MGASCTSNHLVKDSQFLSSYRNTYYEVLCFPGSWISTIRRNVIWPFSGNLPKNSWHAPFTFFFPSSFLLAGIFKCGYNRWSLCSFLGPWVGRTMLKILEVHKKRSHTEWSKSERKRQIPYINAYIWNLEKWYWWT